MINKITLLLVLLLTGTLLGSVTVLSNDNKPRSEHPLQKAWLLNSVIGVAGIILNCAVLLLFIKERNTLITSVNAMIMYTFLYKICFF